MDDELEQDRITDPDQQFTQYTLMLCDPCRVAFETGGQIEMQRRPHHWSFWCPHRRYRTPPVGPRRMIIWREFKDRIEGI